MFINATPPIRRVNERPDQATIDGAQDFIFLLMSEFPDEIPVLMALAKVPAGRFVGTQIETRAPTMPPSKANAAQVTKGLKHLGGRIKIKVQQGTPQYSGTKLRLAKFKLDHNYPAPSTI